MKKPPGFKKPWTCTYHRQLPGLMNSNKNCTDSFEEAPDLVLGHMSNETVVCHYSVYFIEGREVEDIGFDERCSRD